jgi:hypothetical protein
MDDILYFMDQMLSLGLYFLLMIAMKVLKIQFFFKALDKLDFLSIKK